jgi:small ligand-binding sensory domain FIST
VISAVADALHTLRTEAHQERRGDLNGDGQITVADAVIVLQIVVSGGCDDCGYGYGRAGARHWMR